MRATCVAIVVLCAARARAFAERHITDRSLRMVTTPRSALTATSSRDGRGEQRSRRALDPASAGALGIHVLGTRVTLAPEPVIVRSPTWFELLPEPVRHRSFRPKVIVYPMGFATGGGGLTLKLRF